VLPLRWEHDQGRLDELTQYLIGLSGWCQLIVVDGSPSATFNRHAEAWSGQWPARTLVAACPEPRLDMSAVAERLERRAPAPA
jgi:hypothetical protein